MRWIRSDLSIGHPTIFDVGWQSRGFEVGDLGARAKGKAQAFFLGRWAFRLSGGAQNVGSPTLNFRCFFVIFLDCHRTNFLDLSRL